MTTKQAHLEAQIELYEGFIKENVIPEHLPSLKEDLRFFKMRLEVLLINKD